MFSPLDSDIVFTGSADHSVHSWRLSKDLHNNVDLFKSNLIHFINSMEIRLYIITTEVMLYFMF